MSCRAKNCGLFAKNFNFKYTNKGGGIPLLNTLYETEISKNIAKTTITQVYFNDYDNYIETEYFFPITSNFCFIGFEAQFENKIIKGIIKEKEKAKKEFDENVKKGNTAAYAEINKDMPDIMKIDIGNISPKT